MNLFSTKLCFYISSMLLNTNVLFLWNVFLLIHCLPKIKAFCSIFIPCKEKKKIFLNFFLLYNNFFGIPLFFLFFSLISIPSMSSFLSFFSLDNSLYLFLLALALFLYFFIVLFCSI